MPGLGRVAQKTSVHSGRMEPDCQLFLCDLMRQARITSVRVFSVRALIPSGAGAASITSYLEIECCGGIDVTHDILACGGEITQKIPVFSFGGRVASRVQVSNKDGVTVSGIFRNCTCRLGRRIAKFHTDVAALPDGIRKSVEDAFRRDGVSL